jgi:hypothetical protein
MGYEVPVYGDRFSMANAMTMIFYLSINLWVEIQIGDKYSISSRQVQTLTSSSSGQQACFRSVIIESVNHVLFIHHLSTVNGWN